MTTTLFTRAWLVNAAERAIKTAAQATLAIVSVGTAFTGVNWTVAGLTIAAATVGSVLTSVISTPTALPTVPALDPLPLDAGHLEGVLPTPVAPKFQADPPSA